MNIPASIRTQAFMQARKHQTTVYAYHRDPEREYELPRLSSECRYTKTPPRDGYCWAVEPTGEWYDYLNIGDV